MQTQQDSLTLLDRIRTGPVQLGVLIEEELAVISQPDGRGRRLVPLERLDAMSEHDRIIALETGRRSLAARGLVDTSGSAVGPLALTLGIRAHPAMIAIVDRTHGHSGSHRYLYGAGDDILLEEQVEGGEHGFTLCLRPLAASRLVTYIDPEGRAPESDEDPIIRHGDAVERGWDDVTTAVGQVETVTQLFSTRSGPRELATINLSVVAGTRGLVVVGGYGSPADRPDGVEPVMSIRVLSRRSLTAMLMAFVDETPVPSTPGVRHTTRPLGGL
jgi:hypothetical protein